MVKFGVYSRKGVLSVGAVGWPAAPMWPSPPLGGRAWRRSRPTNGTHTQHTLSPKRYGGGSAFFRRSVVFCSREKLVDDMVSKVTPLERASNGALLPVVSEF